MHAPMTSNPRLSEPVYLYCLTDHRPTETIRGNGIDAAFALYVHTFDGLNAVVSGVDVGAFTGPAAEADLQDIQWVAPRAARHAEVVQHVMAIARVLPVQFGTIFSSLSAMHKTLGRHRGTITGFLSRIGHRKEFAVKGYMNRRSALDVIMDAALAEAQSRLSGKSPGAKYVEEKRIQRRSEHRLTDWLHQSRQTIAEQITAGGRELTELKLQTKGEGGANSLEMVLNWALLVEEGDRAAFHGTIDTLNRQWATRGICLESSGPWPPYSFCPHLGLEAKEIR